MIDWRIDIPKTIDWSKLKIPPVGLSDGLALRKCKKPEVDKPKKYRGPIYWYDKLNLKEGENLADYLIAHPDEWVKARETLTNPEINLYEVI